MHLNAAGLSYESLMAIKQPKLITKKTKIAIQNEEVTIIENNNRDIQESPSLENAPLMGSTIQKEGGALNMVTSVGPEINPDRYLVTQYMVPKPLT